MYAELYCNAGFNAIYQRFRKTPRFALYLKTITTEIPFPDVLLNRDTVALHLQAVKAAEL